MTVRSRTQPLIFRLIFQVSEYIFHIFNENFKKNQSFFLRMFLNASMFKNKCLIVDVMGNIY